MKIWGKGDGYEREQERLYMGGCGGRKEGNDVIITSIKLYIK